MTVTHNRHLWPALILPFCLGLLLPPAAPGAQESAESRPPAPRRSSVILIVAQDIGCDDLGCYGSKTTKTPNLDRLAKEGARFTSFYAGSPDDSVSRVVLMLGLNTGHLNFRKDSPGMSLGPDDQTFSQLVKASGYRTTMLGLWGLSQGASGLPQKKGFDQFVGFLDSTKAVDAYPEFIHRYEPSNILDEGYDGRVQLFKNAGGKQSQHVVDVLTEAAMNCVRIDKPEHYNQYQPFFLMLDYPLPQTARESLTDRDKFISQMDAGIGQLLDKLEGLKADANTIVFFTSSRPPQKRNSGDTNTPSEADLRVPFIVRWPERLKPTTVSKPWAAWDIFPTMVSIARKTAPRNIDGISFYPLLSGEEQTNHHDFLYWESHEQGFQQAARHENWMAFRSQAGAKLQLFDLKSDPQEKNDVADKHPDVIEKFEKYLNSVKSESEPSPVRKPEEKPAAEVKQPSTPG